MTVSPRHQRTRVLHMTLAVLTTAVALLATSGVTVADSAAPHGALTPLTGAGACVGRGCSPLRGVAPNGGASRLRLSISADGRSLYAVGGSPQAIAILDRDPDTGAISQPSGRRGCIVFSTPAHRCAHVSVPGHVSGVSITPDGRAISVRARDVSVFARNPRTGALRHRSGSCLTAVSGVCGSLRGLVGRSGSYLVASDTRIVAGYGTKGDGVGIAVLHRVGHGHWRQVSGPAGCVTTQGKDGCAQLPCPAPDIASNHEPFAVTTAAVSSNGGDVYVGGGTIAEYDDGNGFLASFTRTSHGGLRPIGCVASSPGNLAAPTWISPLPNSSTVLISQRYDDSRYDYKDYGERVFASTPGSDGALGDPQRVSGNLGLIGGELVLARDGQTLYGADVPVPAQSQYSSGDLHVYGVTPTSVTPLAAPWSTPYYGETRGGTPQYGADDLASSPDGRFIYMSTESSGAPENSDGLLRPIAPGIRVFAVQP